MTTLYGSSLAECMERVLSWPLDKQGVRLYWLLRVRLTLFTWSCYYWCSMQLVWGCNFTQFICYSNTLSTCICVVVLAWTNSMYVCIASAWIWRCVCHSRSIQYQALCNAPSCAILLSEYINYYNPNNGPALTFFVGSMYGINGCRACVLALDKQCVRLY